MVRKILVLTLPFFFYLPLSLAQTFAIGVRGGVNIGATEYVDRLKAYKDVFPLEAVGVGIPIVARFSKGFALQIEPSFVQKGNSFYKAWLDDKGVPLNIDKTRFVLNYLEAPILAKWSYGSSILGVDILAGPSIGYGLGGYFAYGNRKTYTVESQSFSFKEEGLRTPDVNLNVGVGLHAGNIFIDGRYQMGIVDIAVSDVIAQRIYHRGWSLNIGCLFEIKRKK